MQCQCLQVVTTSYGISEGFLQEDDTDLLMWVTLCVVESLYLIPVSNSLVQLAMP